MVAKGCSVEPDVSSCLEDKGRQARRQMDLPEEFWRGAGKSVWMEVQRKLLRRWAIGGVFVGCLLRKAWRLVGV